MNKIPVKLKLVQVIGLMMSIAVFASVTSAQRYSIKTSDGYLFIQNGKEISFSCEIKAKDLKAVTTGENPSFHSVSEKFLIQILWIPLSNYDPEGKADSSKRLEAHRDWEIDYLNGVFETNLVSESEKLTVGDRSALFWNFKRTKYLTEYDRDTYLTTAIGNDIFAISSPATIGISTAACKDRLVEVMKTLTVSKTPFDVMKIANEIKNSVKS